MQLEFGQTGVSEMSCSVNWIDLVVWTHPPFFRPLERIATLMPIDRTFWRIAEADYCLIFRFIVQRVYRDTIRFLHLPICFLEMEQIADVRFRVSIFPNRNRIFFSRWWRRPLAPRQLSY